MHQQDLWSVHIPLSEAPVLLHDLQVLIALGAYCSTKRIKHADQIFAFSKKGLKSKEGISEENYREIYVEEFRDGSSTMAGLPYFLKIYCLRSRSHWIEDFALAAIQTAGGWW